MLAIVVESDGTSSYPLIKPAIAKAVRTGGENWRLADKHEPPVGEISSSRVIAGSIWLVKFGATMASAKSLPLPPLLRLRSTSAANERFPEVSSSTAYARSCSRVPASLARNIVLGAILPECRCMTFEFSAMSKFLTSSDGSIGPEWYSFASGLHRALTAVHVLRQVMPSFYGRCTSKGRHYVTCVIGE